MIEWTKAFIKTAVFVLLFCGLHFAAPEWYSSVRKHAVYEDLVTPHMNTLASLVRGQAHHLSNYPTVQTYLQQEMPELLAEVEENSGRMPSSLVEEPTYEESLDVAEVVPDHFDDSSELSLNDSFGEALGDNSLSEPEESVVVQEVLRGEKVARSPEPQQKTNEYENPLREEPAQRVVQLKSYRQWKAEGARSLVRDTDENVENSEEDYYPENRSQQRVVQLKSYRDIASREPSSVDNEAQMNRGSPQRSVQLKSYRDLKKNQRGPASVQDSTPQTQQSVSGRVVQLKSYRELKNAKRGPASLSNEDLSNLNAKSQKTIQLKSYRETKHSRGPASQATRTSAKKNKSPRVVQLKSFRPEAQTRSPASSGMGGQQFPFRGPASIQSSLDEGTRLGAENKIDTWLRSGQCDQAQRFFEAFSDQHKLSAGDPWVQKTKQNLNQRCP